MRRDTEKITVYVEPQLKRELQQMADDKRQTITAEARIALAAYVLRHLEKSGALSSAESAAEGRNEGG